jgi:hypothetical protein
LVVELKNLANQQRFPLSSDEHAAYRAIVLHSEGKAKMKDLQEGQQSLRALDSLSNLQPAGGLTNLIVENRQQIAFILARGCLNLACMELEEMFPPPMQKAEQKAFCARLNTLATEPVNFSLLQELRNFVLDALIEESDGYHMGHFWQQVRLLAPILINSLDTLALASMGAAESGTAKRNQVNQPHNQHGFRVLQAS